MHRLDQPQWLTTSLADFDVEGKKEEIQWSIGRTKRQLISLGPICEERRGDHQTVGRRERESIN